MAADAPPPTAVPGEPLLERERELALLRTLLEEAAGGRARLALIEGRAGIGKSRLLAELRALADADAAGSGGAATAGGVRVLTARASEFERELPFGIVRQLFEPLAHDAELADRYLAGAAASARPALTAVDATPGDAAHDSSFAVLHGLYWLVVNLAAEQPLLLSIDDLHWCDRGSLRFLAYLLRRVEDQPVLIATTLRSTEPGTDAALLAELAHDPATVSVRPGPLSPAGIAALVRARLGEDADPAFVDACASGTGGNPLLRQLVTALAADGVAPTAAGAALVEQVGPRALARTVLLRLGRLSPDAVAVARAIAILGETADRPAIAALAGLGDPAVAEATDALARAEILAPGAPPAFVHPLVRDAVYHELPVAERERQHARAAGLLGAAGAPADQIAQHLLATPGAGDPATVEALRAASRSALRKGAADGAVAYLRRALEEPPAPPDRARVLLELGQAEAMTNGVAAAAHLREAYELATDQQARAQAAIVYSRALVFSGQIEEATRLARDAAAALGPELADARQALTAIAALAYSSGLGDYRSTLEVVAPWRERREGSGPGAKMLAAMTSFALAAAGGARAGECAALAREALDGDVLLAFDGGHVSVAATVALGLADDDGALASVDAVRAYAHERGSHFAAMSADLWGGWTHLIRGDLASAEAAMIGGHEAHVAGDFSFGVLFAAAFLAETLVERGDLAGARNALARETIGPDGTEGFQLVRRVRILLALAEGDAAGALELLDGYAAAPICRCIRPGTRGARSTPARCSWTAAATRPPRCWSGSWRSRAAGARRAPSARRCGGWARSSSAPRARRCCARRSSCWPARRAGSSTPRRSPRSAARCGASAVRPRPARRCARRSRSRAPAGPRRSPSGSAASCTPPARARGARRSAARRR